MKTEFKRRLGYLIFTATLTATTIMGSSVAHATLILDTASLAPNGGYSLIEPNQNPLGQSFILTGDTNNIQIGGVVGSANGSFTNQYVFSLVAGAGTGGTLLGSSSFALTTSGISSALHMEDFSFLGTLSAGTYTALFSSGVNGGGGLDFSVSGGDPDSNPYNSAGLLTLNSDPTVDFLVRVTGSAVTNTPPSASVPEPAPFALLGLGLMGLGISRKKRA